MHLSKSRCLQKDSWDKRSQRFAARLVDLSYAHWAQLGLAALAASSVLRSIRNEWILNEDVSEVRCHHLVHAGT